MAKCEICEKEKVFLATTTALRDINLLLNGKNIPNGHLEDLKEELEKNRKDLAFSVTQKTKQESSNTNFEHREAERNKFSVLNIDEDTTQEEYENCIKEAIAIINNAKEKIDEVINEKETFLYESINFLCY